MTVTADCYKGYDSPHAPNALTRSLALNLYAVGVTQDAIAARLNISDETLRKYYRKELDEGMQDMNVVAMNTVFEKVKAGDLKAAIAWLKMRAGWVEALPVQGSQQEEVMKYLLDQLHKQENAKS
jgi:hypothetical protein